MINLIPNEEKKKMVRHFYYRLMVVCLFAVSLGLLASTVAITPSYFLSSIKKKVALDKVAAQKAESVPLPDQETLSAIEILNKKLNIIESTQQNKFSVLDKVINPIVLKKKSDIKIHQISYEKNTEGSKIIIKGAASSRERLLLFRRTLEDDPLFKQVDLPISNFVRGSNIQFYLSLTP